ncbi:MAG: class I adenylate-forming enzyme family protein [Opitutales bacterium]
MAEPDVAQWLWARVERIAERTLLIDAEGETTIFGEFFERVEALRPQFTRDVLKGSQTVAFAADARAETLALMFALACEGHVLAPLFAGNEAERADRLREGRVTLEADVRDGQTTLTPVVSELRIHKLVAGLQAAKRPGLLLFSSGSTGKPKAMLHDFLKLITPYGLKPLKDLRLLLFMALDHIGGIDTLLRTFTNGSTLVAAPARDPETVARILERHRVQVLPASPTFLNLLLLSGAPARHDLSSLRIIAYGAEPMPQALLERLADAFPQASLQQKFGTSETNAIRVQSRDSRSLEIRIDAADTQYRIEDGELLLKTPARILGYLNAQSDALAAAGWFRTGDLVEASDDGWLRIVGRKREVINVGGEKVLPGEVEDFLSGLAEVADCTVFGRAHPMMGQVVAAQVVPAEGVDAATVKKVVRMASRQSLEAWKVPVHIEVVEALKVGSRFKKQRMTEHTES